MTIKDKNSRNSSSRPKESSKSTSADKNPTKDQRFKDRWNQINCDVHTALNHWNEVTEKYDGKLSRDQEQLREIKCLLKELQKKIKIFND